MQPTIIDQKFLTQEELEDIKSKVFMLRDHWKGVNSQTEDNKLLLSRVLPAGAYSKYFSEQDIASNNEIMFEHFSFYYNKIKDKLSSYYNIPIHYAPNLQYPGFHIHLNNDGDNVVEKSNVSFHMDTFPKLRKILRFENIESIIIPISLPSSGGKLVWNNSAIRTENDRFAELDSDNVFHYTDGMMAVWPGRMWHSIGPFTLMNSSEYRITMQMHVNLRSDQGTIFW